jgi:hypothetical protein
MVKGSTSSAEIVPPAFASATPPPGGVCPNVLIGAVLIANYLILGRFETREFHSKRASLSQVIDGASLSKSYPPESVTFGTFR